MEWFINYLITSLCGSNSIRLCSHKSDPLELWIFCFNEAVYLTFDRRDIDVIRKIYKKRIVVMTDNEKAAYEKLFKLFE